MADKDVQATDESTAVHFHVRQPRVRGVELATGGGDIDRPRLVPQLCLLFCDDDGGAIAPGRQPFERLGHDQLLIRTPAQVLPFVQAADGSAVSCRIIFNRGGAAGRAQ